MISSDKDFFQILDEKTVLYRPTQSEVLNQKRVLEKYEIHPTNFALARALVGDKSDNLPGIPGVGLATVAKNFSFLRENKTFYFEDLVKAANQALEIKKSKVLEKIRDSRGLVEQNYKMMQLYSPLLSASLKIKITEKLENYRPQFNKTGLRKEMIMEGFGEVTLEDLFHSFRNTVSGFSTLFSEK